MSRFGFDLVPVDGDGGAPIHLPPGETVLGRGPLLAVSDKRVSRLHGLLENLDGRLRLKPKQSDVWRRRTSCFSRARCGSTSGGVEPGGGRRSRQKFEQGLQTRNRAGSYIMSISVEGGSAQPKEVEEDQSDVSPSAARRRVLPAWMMAAAAAAHSSSSSPKVQSAAKRSKGPAAASTGAKRAAAKRATPAKTSSPEEAELSQEEMPKKRRRKMSDEEAAQSKTDVPSERPTVRLQSESNGSEVSDESDGFAVEADEEGRGGATFTADVNATTRTYAIRQPENEGKKSKNGRQMTERSESVGSNGGSASGPAPSKPRLRAPCPYGKDCYRKNPVHFQECSHPGDTDYEEEEEEEEADRPECPYGTDCYRKNPLHRKEYKHTEKPASTSRTVPRKPPADDEDEDFGDDDSFINDDSEDVGDDSDYVPPDSDDSGKEDIKGLQKEAKAFVKRRK
ncbi:aprataxin and PNK-like factor isoform X4 [Siniperca chuatsi]|uniref:aprataxin and PNK-like factor isoform X4 n=1 Tax=Siniperca chuatsi TaxID=119488 RepID=UPI001CE03F29|nr:aprataxin and PNK-like factor isoform X4 [Siniperca chuatsi]